MGVVSALLALFNPFILPAWSQNQATGVHLINEVKHDTSPSLREMMATATPPKSATPPHVIPVHPTRTMPATAAAPVADPALQHTGLPFVAATLGLNFEGVGNGQYGFTPNAAPPDTNGAVGATQYVQWVNESFAVFDKNTGALLAGPTTGNTLWSGFGGGCQTNNDGDPIAQYDKIANRWVMTQFSVSTTPFLQCVAVSTTSDATGTYNRYAFSFGSNFPDYPKLGVWPDAYYMSFNMFNASGTAFLGAQACALNRAKMLAGQAATMICKPSPLSSGIDSLLPSDMDGTIQPTSGEPAFFIDFTTNA